MNVAMLTTNLVRRPIEGCVITASGRLIPQPPWIIPDSPLTAVAYDDWLVTQARKEAMDTGENWLLTKLVGITGALVDADLRYLLSDFLFGQPNPVFEAVRNADEGPPL